MIYNIKELLIAANDHQASDLHVTVGSPPFYRINGQLLSFEQGKLTSENTKKMAKDLLQHGDWETFLKKGELDFSYSIEGVARFRLNIYYQRQQISLVARVIAANIPSLEQLGMPVILQRLTEKSQGLILVTGPTGSGKTTTLAAMIQYINEREEKHIITLEDPIEYLHAHQRSIVHQREVGLDTNNFASGLRAALRQDPDIILVGEMRDLETISTAITAAETGHLVLATLHTNGAVQTINRIIDVFPPYQQSQVRIQLASVLKGIVSQRLLANVDGTGRIAATEILINQPSIANLIRNEKADQITNILQTSRSQGMHSLEVSVKELLVKNMITIKSAQPYLQRVSDY